MVLDRNVAGERRILNRAAGSLSYEAGPVWIAAGIFSRVVDSGGENDAIFDFLKPYVDDLLNNPNAEESILTKGIEKFALATFRKYNTESVESVILPVLDRITGKIV